MAIHADKLRWLFWLRWKMFTRSLVRDKGRVVGLIFLILFGLPFVGGFAVGTFFAYRYLPAPANAEVLFLVLSGVYLVWSALPLLEFTVNEGLDISKLALFPLTRAELMLSLLFSTLLDVPTLGLFLILAAVVVGWASAVPLALIALLAMLIFYVQVVGMSQLVLALLMRILQSRRFRDLSIVLLAIFASSFYFFQQFALRGLGSGHFVENIDHLSLSTYLQWLPPGMAARAIQQASVGNWGVSFAWLFALLVMSVLVLYLWQLVVERGLVSAESGGGSRAARQRPTEREALAGVRVGSSATLSPVLAIAVKDMKYLRRDPQQLALLFQTMLSTIVVLVATVFNPSSAGRGIGSWAVLAAPAFVFLSLNALTLNMLGMEGESLTTLLLFPIEPKRILWGKNLVILALGSIEMLLLVAVTAFASQGWNFVLPALTIGFAGIAIVLGCGNFSSVCLPQRRRQRRGFQTTTNYSSESGFARLLLSLLMLLVTVIVLIPAGVALVLPILFHAQWFWSFSIPLSLLYGIAFYFVVTALVAPRILDKAPEILAVVARE
ncbi:MAG: hypothetical protein JO125_12930 [Chloroflexi bacterium]|nr:hypothetical protein [Chloroflexota bacterium]